MPEISRFFGIVIKIYYIDHFPPHFHAEYGEYFAELSIDTLEILQVNMPQRALGLILEWASLHRDELRVDWSKARSKEPLLPIDPLV